MIRKTILITGASTGLGRGMALEFAKMGRDLALCARRMDALEELKAEITAINPNIRVDVKALDVCDYEAVFDVFRAFREEMGQIDRFILNAGVGLSQPIGTGQFAGNLKTAETNFVALVAQSEAAMEILRDQQQGHLVIISSVAAIRGMRGPMAVYNASKAAASSLAEGLRMEVMGKDIEVSTIHPGYILTDINRSVENAPFRIPVEEGCKLLVESIEKEPANSFVPTWPWAPLAKLMRILPLSVLRKIAG